MNGPVTITMIKSLLRAYHKERWCCIWRDCDGVHMSRWPYNETYVGRLFWCRYKGET